MKITVILAAAIGLIGTTSLAQTAAVRVSYADLDLSTRAGRAVLDHRIARAANLVCDTADFPSDLEKYAAGRSCRDRTVTAAKQAVALKIAPRYAAR